MMTSPVWTWQVLACLAVCWRAASTGVVGGWGGGAGGGAGAYVSGGQAGVDEQGQGAGDRGEHGLALADVVGVLGDQSGGEDTVTGGPGLAVVALDEPAAVYGHQPGVGVGDVTHRPGGGVLGWGVLGWGVGLLVGVGGFALQPGLGVEHAGVGFDLGWGAG
jgi:hypothetical protein